MKTKPIAVCFAVFSASAAAFRFIELLYCVDPVTGFYFPGRRFFSLFAVLSAVAVFVIIAVLTAKEPPVREAGGDPPPALTFASALCFLGFFVDFVFKLTSETRPSFLMVICSALILAYFLARVWCGIAGAELYPMLAFFPLPYWLYFLVKFFIDISDMAVISASLYRMAALMLMLLCFTLAAKLRCRVDAEKSSKRLTCLSLTAGAVVSAGCISEYLALSLGKGNVLRYGEFPEITLTLSAFYLAVYVFCGRRSRRGQSEN